MDTDSSRFRLNKRDHVLVDGVDFTRVVREYNRKHPDVTRDQAYDNVAQFLGCHNHHDLRRKAQQPFTPILGYKLTGMHEGSGVVPPSMDDIACGGYGD